MRRYGMPAVVSACVVLLVLGAVALALWQAPQGVAQEQQPLLAYPDYPPTPTIPPLPASEASLAGGTPLASASFDEAAALAAWELVDLEPILPENRANWVINAEGRLEQDEAGRAGNPSIQEAAALTGAADWTDYTVAVQFYDLSNGTAGLIARYSGASGPTASYYRYRIIKDSFEARPKQVLEKVEQGVATTLVALEGPGFAERTWHRLTLTAQGGRLTATVNGEVVAEAVDAQPLPAGKAGLYTRAIGGILFDNFSVVED